MAREIRIDGDVWKVHLSKHPPHPGVQAVVFFPVTSDQRPYRVVEVSEDRIAAEEDLEAVSDRELQEMYDGSSSMGYPHSYA